MKAGVGGTLRNKSNKESFMFSGPVSATIPYDAELQACQFLLNEILRAWLIKSKTIICTNSVWIHGNFCRKKWEDKSFENSFNNVFLMHCDREFNFEADFLANQGRNLNSLFSEWKYH